jgi:hypothetical protein
MAPGASDDDYYLGRITGADREVSG